MSLPDLPTALRNNSDFAYLHDHVRSDALSHPAVKSAVDSVRGVQQIIARMLTERAALVKSGDPAAAGRVRNLDADIKFHREQQVTALEAATRHIPRLL